MNRQTAENYLSRLIELGFDLEPWGDSGWFFGESKKKEYIAHVILEDDKELDSPHDEFHDRVRIWNATFDNQIQVPELEDLTLAQLDINSLKCRGCGQTVASFKQMKLEDFDCAYCKQCIKLK